jgi:hypothetical protein
LYSSPDISRTIKSRRIRWVGHVVCIGELRNEQNVLVTKREVRDHSEDLSVDGRIILKRILVK